ncbi:DUF4435 domain-containing protein [Burkholderia gladioli]|uniref:DUF4435 domain-containing protein n=1 Tax=Burkholderia gladioli TaxID=28095 RepID=UPI00163EEF26|nr:DUF4435 domain-containing protein [Burkholderia gladioli]
MKTQDGDPLPRREGPGLRNLDLFLAGTKSSPICFYFEDEGCEELYARFLRRLFPKLDKPLVICTGGKTKKQVLDSANGHGIQPVVYIQDKDLDDIIGSISTDERVVTLNRYSFENYLLEPNALLELTIESKRRLSKANITELVDISGYMERLYENFLPLGTLYAYVLRKNLRSIKTMKQSIFDVCEAGAIDVSEEALRAYQAKVLAAALAAQKVSTEEEFMEQISVALSPKPQYANFADNHPNAHLCGKQLLELTLSYIDSKVGTTLLKLEQFEVSMRLLLHVSMTVFERVRQSVTEAITKQETSKQVLALLE